LSSWNITLLNTSCPSTIYNPFLEVASHRKLKYSTSTRFKRIIFHDDIRSTSASPDSTTSLPTFIAKLIIPCNPSSCIPLPAEYPSVNPTDSQNTTFRFSETEFSGTVAIAYRSVVTRISLGKASKKTVFSTYSNQYLITLGIEVRYLLL
jgi:hypothetical protein